MPEKHFDQPGRRRTIRQQLQLELEQGPISCRELSQRLHQSEREVLDHLHHLRRTLQRQGRNLGMIPATCRKCEYRFAQRKRLEKPGKCPVCRQTGIEPPLYYIAGKQL